MIPIPRRLPLAVALCCTCSGVAQAADEQDQTLDAVVVTAAPMAEPLVVTTDPKAPRQPIPAHDGADFLKTIPGFSVIRKGGTDGDPVFRGLSGSRLGILLDGQEIYGGCGGRMDPPTAYVYPESYDRVTVLKGPQSVLYGAGTSAGVVMFDRDIRRFTRPDWKFDSSLTFGSFDRNDQVVDLRAGNPGYYTQFSATRSDSNDYRDGDGKRVHSAYTRWSTYAALGWTPDDDTRLELSAGRSDGEAAYADRAMDGAKFARENVALKLDKKHLTPLIDRIEGQVYYSYVDHVMDNYSLRAEPTQRNVSNPDRRTWGGRLAVTLTPDDRLMIVAGADGRTDQHRSRRTVNYRNMPWDKDFGFRRGSVFSELTYMLDDMQRLKGGLRLDRHSVKDYRVGATKGKRIRDTLPSAFARYEGDYAEGAGTWYAGLGHSERFPDFWEYMRAAGGKGESFSSLKPEKMTQLDVGTLWSSQNWSASVSGFYGKIDDYIMVRWTPETTVHNIDATLYGLEGDVTWRFARNWNAFGSLAWVHGKNDSDGKALAQQQPLEARLGLEYNDRVFSTGALLRLVSRQNRYDRGAGGIAGQDLGSSSGFAVFSLNAGWRPSKQLLLTAGIDNLFDRTYREHLAKSAVDIDGYNNPLGQGINEPGRTLWVKARLTLD